MNSWSGGSGHCIRDDVVGPEGHDDTLLGWSVAWVVGRGTCPAPARSSPQRRNTIGIGIPAPLSRRGTVAKREASWFRPPCENEKVEQLAANRLTIPQDAIASLLQRLVRHALVSYVFDCVHNPQSIIEPRIHWKDFRAVCLHLTERLDAPLSQNRRSGPFST